MNSSGLTAGDVLALTKNDGMDFGGVGGFILLFIFLMAIGGNGFGFGGNNGVSQMATADLLYNQSTDSAIRGLAQGQCGITDTILNSKYDTALMLKDASQQLSNSVASIGNLVVQENQATRNMILQNKIDTLADTITVLRGENSNLKQTSEITQNILSNLSTTAPKPPCYYGCGCSSLY